MQGTITQKRVRNSALVVSVALVLAACSGTSEAPGDNDDNSDGTNDEVTTVRMTIEPSAIPVFIAADRGFFEGVKVTPSEVGYGEVQALLLSGDTDIAWMSPIEAAEFNAEGSDFKYFSTAGAQNMYNGVVVQTEDASMYKSVTDLMGKKLGIPGFGTGTWTSFASFTKAFYGIDDAKAEFEVVTADSGALLALLEKGEIDAALLFSGTSAAARSFDQFTTIFSFTEAMQEATGEPLPVNGSVATTKWLEENPDAAAKVIAGIDKATEWINDNPDAFSEGGEYSDLAEAAGWLTGPETTQTVQKLISEGKWFLTSDIYTQDWIDATYELIKTGAAAGTSVADKDAVFIKPDALS